MLERKQRDGLSLEIIKGIEKLGLTQSNIAEIISGQCKGVSKENVISWLKPGRNVNKRWIETVSRICSEQLNIETTFHASDPQHMFKLNVFKEDHITKDVYQSLADVLVGSYYKYKITFAQPDVIIVTNVVIYQDEDGRLIYDQISDKAGESLHYRGEVYCMNSNFNILAEDVNNGHSSELLFMCFRLPTQSFGSITGIVTGIDKNGAPSSSKIMLKKISLNGDSNVENFRETIVEENKEYTALFKELSNDMPVIKVIESIKDAVYWERKLT